MLSLAPRLDLFRFAFPKDFLPKDIETKYRHILEKNSWVITTPIDYLNESIQGIKIPGISDINIQQTQHSNNSIHIKSSKAGQVISDYENVRLVLEDICNIGALHVEKTMKVIKNSYVFILQP